MEKPGSPGHSAGQAASFDAILSAEFQRSGGIRLSAHAERRLVERNVTLEPEDMRKIEGAVQKAAAKGSRESLVIYGDLALVASVRNRTIITALEGKDMTEHVFTNIDSAVIIRKGDTPAEAKVVL
ncbi:MAG: flagellar protein [Peptococcaceae bacterium]|nr:flagellar protein [Peptococcaceae bacterium]